jgi:diadenosine tetraphosphate (Ap4A) HIT family hydrolase
MYIYETENFEVISHEQPFVSRTDGGHIKIVTKHSVEDRIKLSPKHAIELARLTMLVGEAFQIAMNNRGIPVMKVNYEDLGNWAWKTGKKPHLHIHLFGRSKDAIKQIWPEAVYLPARETGFYDGFEAVNNDDISEIQKQISILEKLDKYNLKNWFLQ